MALALSIMFLFVQTLTTSSADKDVLLSTALLPNGWGFTSYSSPGKSRNGWDFVIDEGPGAFKACDSEVQGADNWLTSSWIDVSQADFITIQILYTQRNCAKQPSSQSMCNNDVSVSRMFASSPQYSKKPSETSLAPLGVLDKQSDYLEPWTNYLWMKELSLNVSGQLGLHLVFHDQGSCTLIQSIDIFSTYCPKTTLQFAQFPKTDMRRSGVYSLVVESSECVPHASSSGQYPSAGCSNGDWKVLRKHSLKNSCSCNPGYYPDNEEQTCRACETQSYKNERGNVPCKACPERSYAPAMASKFCACVSGYFRPSNVSVDTPCFKPPSAPILVNDPLVEHTDVTIMWKERLDQYHRVEWYTVRCDNCEGFRDQRVNGNKITLQSLRPLTAYTVKIFAENYVTDKQTNIANYLPVTFVTGSRPEINIVHIESSTRSRMFSLAWTVEPNTFKDFDVHLFRNGALFVVYGCNGATHFDVPIQQSGTYHVKVCLQGNENICSQTAEIGNVDSMVASVSPPREIVLGAALILASILLILMVLLVAIWCYRKSHLKQLSRSPDWKLTANSLAHVPTLMSETGRPNFYAENFIEHQTFMDPNAYEEPEKLLFELSREIYVEQIQFLKNSDTANSLGGCINNGCLLQKASLTTTDNQPCGILVKTVCNSDPENLRIFFVESATMVQFYHPNVQMLFGCVIRGSEVMTCLEYASQGALDVLLHENPQMFSPRELVHILRGVACGMQYLSELGYIHKVLSSQNILLAGSSVPKISGFDMRAHLDHEEVTGSKPTLFSSLLPWMAPEVVANGMYSTQSDVYSFGVLMWELFSGGQRPFSNHGKVANEGALMSSAGPGTCLSAPVGCSQYLYDVMRHCWVVEPSRRPTFDLLRGTLEKVVRNSEVLNEKYSFEALYPTSTRKPSTLKETNGQYLHLSSYYPAGLDTQSPFYVANNQQQTTYINQNSTIEDWLTQLKLSQYTSLFYSRNLILVNNLFGSTPESLELLGITSSKHRKKMINSLSEIKNASFFASNKKQNPVHIII